MYRNISVSITHRPTALLAGLVLLASVWLAPAAVSPLAAEDLATGGGAAKVGVAAVTCDRCKGCGCKGGPGYRGPNGRCVGHKQLTKICGVPASTNCKAEQVGSSAPVCNTGGQSRTSSRRDTDLDGRDGGIKRGQKAKAGKQA